MLCMMLPSFFSPCFVMTMFFMSNITKLQLRCHCCLLTNHLQSGLHKLQANQQQQWLQSSTRKSFIILSVKHCILVHIQVACTTCAHTSMTCDLQDYRLADNLQGKQSASTANVKQMRTCVLVHQGREISRW
jgi:hypothetical protein